MEITETYKAVDRSDWRRWLDKHHQSKREVWLLYDDRDDVSTVSYLDSVEEAICFGWIDGIQKRVNANERAQRFSPRNRKSNWTELNKARARRLINLGRMTEAGYSSLPDLHTPFFVPNYVLDAIEKVPKAAANFKTLPSLYLRVRIGYIDEMQRKPEELEKRLSNFVNKTAEGKLFGNWNDGGRLDDDA